MKKIMRINTLEEFITYLKNPDMIADLQGKIAARAILLLVTNSRLAITKEREKLESIDIQGPLWVIKLRSRCISKLDEAIEETRSLESLILEDISFRD